MSLFTILMEIVLLIWFFGCICTYRLGKYLLVEGVGIKSAEFVMFCLYGIGIIARLVFLMVGKWYLLVVLILWLVIQFFCHWYYTIFGASEIKLKGYNECFKAKRFAAQDSGTVFLIPLRSCCATLDIFPGSFGRHSAE